MIIQKILKGIPNISLTDARLILATGIICNWWRKVGTIQEVDIPKRLTARNLDWHQNHYSDPDPHENNEPFGLHTPFISTTAGTVERNAAIGRNLIFPAWQVAMEFATKGWACDGVLFYGYVFVLGRPSVPHRGFSEEIRELNIYTRYSPFHPEGEITAKISIPPPQIEWFEYYDLNSTLSSIMAGMKPQPAHVEVNSLFVPPSEISNIREFLI